MSEVAPSTWEDLIADVLKEYAHNTHRKNPKDWQFAKAHELRDAIVALERKASSSLVSMGGRVYDGDKLQIILKRSEGLTN